MYSAKEPEIGIRTAISPRARSMKYTTAPPTRYTSRTAGPAAWIAPAEP